MPVARIYKKIVRATFMDDTQKEYITTSDNRIEHSGIFIIFNDKDFNLIFLSSHTIKDIEVIHTKEGVEE